ncbi:NmrA family NAD(P)-binding protein [Sphingobium chungbukense]|uniref:NmrA-like domain-containing protein n=1 Tax=Sphingobium chungbukense TaxID=56193 RepID=A0A0M3APU3_9SPHN|nr:NmrA family NAD(P)-binding protein [Sphingobium chungbukense]KKW91850.1 hypothetical protein YP76_12120 [Sphingobium chungbukense]
MTILVTGATGTQGGAVALALLARGKPVRALVRDPHAASARALEQAGAMLAVGRFEDSASLRTALSGVDALFSVQTAPGAERDGERMQARALIDAARAENVRHVVHSSVSNSGAFRSMEGWAEGRWERNYWESKEDAEAIVGDAGFRVHTILRPAFMMDNFAMPKAAWMFPDLAQGAIRTALAPETPMVLIAADDIARMACAAFEAPPAFAGQIIELAGDLLTLPEIAGVLATVKGRKLVSESWNADALIARGQHDGWVRTQEWMNIVNYPARPEEMLDWGIEPTSFTDWARRHADMIDIGAQEDNERN